MKALKSKYGLSILVLAHTPKRDSGKPLGRNDLQGSKMIINFCDSAFAIGESAKNIGWRLDMVAASAALVDETVHCVAYRDVGTSDHGPVIAHLRDTPASGELRFAG